MRVITGKTIMPPPEDSACIPRLAQRCPRDFLFYPQEISEIADVELRVAVSDGSVYGLTRR